MQHSFVHITVIAQLFNFLSVLLPFNSPYLYQGEGRVLFMAEVLRTYPCRNVVGVMVLAHQPGIEESLEAAGLHTFLQVCPPVDVFLFRGLQLLNANLNKRTQTKRSFSFFKPFFLAFCFLCAAQLFVMMQKWVFLLGSVLCFTLLVLNCYSNVKPYMVRVRSIRNYHLLSFALLPSLGRSISHPTGATLLQK